MDDMRIFGLYGLNLSALMISVSEINPILQFLVLIATLTYTLVNIVKALKK
jgi:hypothetical protein